MQLPKYDPCPNCGSDEVVEILYGYPSPEMRKDVEQGRAVLGGCLLEPGEDINDIHLACRNCDWSETFPDPRS